MKSWKKVPTLKWYYNPLVGFVKKIYFLFYPTHDKKLQTYYLGLERHAS
jgi:hypothetical protein